MQVAIFKKEEFFAIFKFCTDPEPSDPERVLKVESR